MHKFVPPKTAFSADGSNRTKKPRQHANTHLKWIRRLPCCIPGCQSPRDSVHAAHIRYADGRYNKRGTGMGEKPSDRWTVPLCASHHVLGENAQHSAKERRWWRLRGIDPLALAQALWMASGDDDEGEKAIVEQWEKRT